ncbi:hypothetical protein GWI33_004775 [Rhynchophorus ferrugineus]|uniref:Cytochrome P450 n=1 Tax=Rhynchophorus ferrugineus TaxID=354439 RepID=A0A834IIG3_RHYFE|nr:hypothetical protein GWI33_004775 [Rhynchophorus ferrugineus]
MLLYVVLALVAFILYVKYKQSYWKRRGLYQFEPDFFVGNGKNEILGRRSIFLLFRDIYEKARALKQDHVGIYFFLEPLYIPTNLNIIKQIMIKDFPYFQGHGGFAHPNDRLSMNLFNLEGELWRNLRTKLTPTFTSGKMKMMFETLVSKTDGLEKLIDGYITRKEPVDIKEAAARFTTDIIASCAFGIESDALHNDKNDFREFGKKVFKPNPLVLFLASTVPAYILGPLGFRFIAQDVEEFFIETVMNTIQYREKNKIVRKDFMHLLLQLRNTEGNKATDAQTLTDDELIAQCFVFFLAGFETSSTTITFTLLELGLNQDIQDKLRAEINDVLDQHDGRITYEAMMEMKYLDMVINETLRKHPPAASISRVCSKKYEVPGTGVTIEKGTKVQIPVWGIHMDPEYYPEPDKFNPENFSAENKAKRSEMAFIPFGEGPRMCIGLRFGVMQTKIGLISLLKNFKFTVNEKTRTPIQMEKVSFVLSVEGDVWLNASRV